MSESSFGDYIRALRVGENIGQRELARNIGISAAYLNDIEKSKRPAPRGEIVTAMAEIFSASEERIFDLAALSKGDIPPDIGDLVRSTPSVVSLLRGIRAYGLSETEIRELEKSMISSKAKAIILAAGMGTRLRPLTEDLPKCMLEFGGKTLLQRQLEAYRQCGVTDISIVRGYKKEKIDYEAIKYFENTDYENNNILNSIFYAEDEINDHVIISYSDILFESPIVERLLQSESDISIVVDIDWRGYYVDRKDHPLEEAESVIFDADNNVVSIGKLPANKHDVHGEFIGMMKLTPRGAEVFKRHFHRAKSVFAGKPFQRAATFEKAYLTDMIQEMSDLGVSVHCVIIERGWKEIDTVEDYQKALREFSD